MKGLVVKSLLYFYLFRPRVSDLDLFGVLMDKVGNFIHLDHIMDKI